MPQIVTSNYITPRFHIPLHQTFNSIYSCWQVYTLSGYVNKILLFHHTLPLTLLFSYVDLSLHFAYISFRLLTSDTSSGNYLPWSLNLKVFAPFILASSHVSPTSNHITVCLTFRHFPPALDSWLASLHEIACAGRPKFNWRVGRGGSTN